MWIAKIQMELSLNANTFFYFLLMKKLLANGYHPCLSLDKAMLE